MTLSASSRLHWWSARGDSIPIYGGKPVHSRNSAGGWVDQRGIVQGAIVNTPRFNIADLGDGFGRRKVMRLEQSRTNLCLQSQFASGWVTVHSTLVAGGTPSPDGLAGASGLSEDAAAAQIHGTETTASIAITNGAAYTSSVFVKQNIGTRWLAMGDGTGNLGGFQYFDVTNGVVGALGPGITARGIDALGGGWYRCWVTATATGTTTIPLLFLASGDGVSVYNGDGTSGIKLFGFQLELGASVSTYIATTGTASTRSADSFKWDFTFPPQAMMIYIRFIERGHIASGSTSGLFSISNAAGSNMCLFVFVNGGNYRMALNATAGNVASQLAVAPAIGDTVELNCILFPNGSIEVDQSINGAAVVAAGQSGALALDAAWSEASIYLNGPTASIADYAEFKAVKYGDVVGVTAQQKMDELRAFDFGGNGTQL